MAEVKCVATRESYGNALKELAQNGADNLVVLDADLSATTKTAIFKNAFPDRHINCGIAESNMMSVAAGLSTMGYVPFASSFAMFAAGRAFEQIRNSVGYPHLNVKIGATHAGISVGEDGASHQCFARILRLCVQFPEWLLFARQTMLRQGRLLFPLIITTVLFIFASAGLLCPFSTMTIINLKSEKASLLKRARCNNHCKRTYGCRGN